MPRSVTMSRAPGSKKVVRTVILHSERVSRVDRGIMRDRVKALEEKYPAAKVSSRWSSRGGYFTLTASTTEEAVAVVQLRGTCQVCGGAQALRDGRIVLHGYNRPGWGYTVGRCQGVGHKPAEHDLGLARSWADSLTTSAATMRATLTEAGCTWEEGRGDYAQLPKALRWSHEKTDRETAHRLQEVDSMRRGNIAHAEFIRASIFPRFSLPLYEVLK